MSTSMHDHDAGPSRAPLPDVPPVDRLCTLALALVVVGGIIMASSAPKRPPLVLPSVIAAVAVGLLVVAAALLARARSFAWTTFRLVAKWVLLAYVIEAGVIAFSLVKNHVRGAPLALFLVMLGVFATSVPLIIGFTVARHERPST